MAPQDHSIRAHLDVESNLRSKDKVVVVMGATGAGKSRLSVDLASQYFPSSEIINCDKIQLYRGLDITTNKIPERDQNGVVHHLLGEFENELSAAEYRSVASKLINDVVLRGNVPFLVGGSNSFIHALLAETFDPMSDPFSGSGSVSSSLQFSCCFLWVDVSAPVLDEYLSKRVDEMLNSGMFEELENYLLRSCSAAVGAAIEAAIGVPEFLQHFRQYPRSTDEIRESSEWIESYERAVKAVKDNTCHLAKRQEEKIRRLSAGGWNLNRLDATATFKAVLAKDPADEAWKRDVVEPSVEVVKRFLADE